MDSKSRIAQEKLAGLEKASAPFEEQIREAGNFVDIDLDKVATVLDHQKHEEKAFKKKCAAGSFHGREEWLLRWLLKKLQSPKDKTARTTPSSWHLFRLLLNAIPLANTARMLTEKKFIVTLQQTLQEAQEISEIDDSGMEVHNDSMSGSDSGETSIISKKRKRTGELVTHTYHGPAKGLRALVMAIHTAINSIVRSTKVSSSQRTAGNGRSPAFTTEYMRAVVRTTPEASAMVLGSWMSLCQMIIRTEDLMQFSLHCSEPLLALLKMTKVDSTTQDWKEILEKLIARNIIIPSKASAGEKQDSTLLQSLTRVLVLQDVANAPILFDIAIRSLQSNGDRRRRPSDNAWLQTVFTTLKSAMPPTKTVAHNSAIREILQRSIQHEVDLGLPELKSLTAEYVVPEGSTDWYLLETVMKLDANVFLIADSDKNLLNDVLERVTNVYFEITWPEQSRHIVSEIVVPLMDEFAKARDLSGFVRHWYSQLVKFEQTRKEDAMFPADAFLHLVDWLAIEIVNQPNAVVTILEAIANSISREDVVDIIGTRLYHVIFDNGNLGKLNGRYSWRAWRVLTRSFHWMQPLHLEEISELWEQQASPFTILSAHTFGQKGLDNLEIFRCACSAWNASEIGTKLESLSSPVVLRFLEQLGPSIGALIDQKWQIMKSGLFTSTRYHEAPNGLHASLAKTSTTEHVWNHEAFAALWFGVLRQDCVLNQSSIISRFIDVLLSCQSQEENPLTATLICNYAVIESLTRLPLEVISKKYRERIMQSWSTDVLAQSPECYPAVLALKLKIMHRPTFYTGMKYKEFEEIEKLIKKVGFEEMPKRLETLITLRELVKLTLSHVTSNLDQSQNRKYILDAISYFQDKLSKYTSDEKKTKGRKLCLSSLHHTIVSNQDLTNHCTSFRKFLLLQLQRRLKKKPKIDEVGNHKDGSLSIVVILQALDSLGVESSEIEPLATESQVYIAKLNEGKPEVDDVRQLLPEFFATHASSNEDGILHMSLEAFINTSAGRAGIKKKMETITSEMGNAEKLQLLQRLMGEELIGLTQLDKLVAVKYVIGACDNVGHEPANAKNYQGSMDLCLAYDLFCTQIIKTNSYRVFALLGEIMEMMLKTKRRALSQWSIDRTLAIVAIICSSKGPLLPTSQASNIFIRLCTLMKVVLTNHRFRLEGHLHSVIQVLQPLLRCLFTAHSHTSKRLLQAFTPPPWLSHFQPSITSSSSNTLSPIAAESFTRLLTLICDPTPNSISHSSVNNLTSAVAKAKKIAGQHMHIILQTYIKFNLEMTMKSEVRTAMTPGLYAIFGCTDMEGRKAVVDGLDSSARAVWGTLYKDWARFGKWKGA
ncbi:putative urb2 npa2 family protein [Botrytis fragariae]|uniref:Putative urb2 npa2 family protein n=1 Tax=Botrytis fragariae TaxID=1964551 RepID=A0A8H6AW82_9HELO|nr:putative urb2 npa2 family protein [Botrytis fragariae]KAF5874717.1 putative urb2 npa2 family protein [Botrytis fragariae]